VGKRSGLYPPVRVDGVGKGVVSRAGGALLTATIRASGLDAALSAVLAPWRKPLAIHDPAKVLTPEHSSGALRVRYATSAPPLMTIAWQAQAVLGYSRVG
jgi:hypothetical protein